MVGSTITFTTCRIASWMMSAAMSGNARIRAMMRWDGLRARRLRLRAGLRRAKSTPIVAIQARTSYAAYDGYGNTVASVDSFGAANSSLYSSAGCSLATAPSIHSSSWTLSHYTGCTTYDGNAVLATGAKNVLGQST